MSVAQKSIYEMSDDEILGVDPALLEEARSEAPEPAAEPAPVEAVPAAEPAPAAEAEETDDADEAYEGDAPAAPAASDPAASDDDQNPDEPAAAAGAAEADAEDETAKPEATDPAAGQGPAAEGAPADLEKPAAEPEKPAEEFDYKAAYTRLTAPFKANGQEMKVDNVDDAITLMQMGANYSKKMAALKPNLKLMKMLENNKLLDADKISFLIDLDKKNPEAIQKLVKESGLDLLEMEEGKSEYKPGTYTVDDREIELDGILDKIQDTPTFSKTVDLVSNKWDGPSKQAVVNAPQLLEVLNDHLANGIYDVISNEVMKRRTLGRLNGLSDLDAYWEVGNDLNTRGGFDHLSLNGSAAPDPAPRREVTPAPAAPAAPARNDKRRAASPTPTEATPAKAKADFNPLSLSDDDFAKLTHPQVR